VKIKKRPRLRPGLGLRPAVVSEEEEEKEDEEEGKQRRRCIGASIEHVWASPCKLTWLVLGGDPAARSHRVEQFTALSSL
jgi:hypothetical protein